MKTTSLDEIVFRDRNQNYGAYELRKRYDRTVIISFLVALFIVSGMVGVPMVQAMMNKNKASNVKLIIDFTPTAIDPGEIIPPPPPPPPPAAPQIQKLVYQVPNVVDTVMNEANILTIEEALDNGQNDPVPVDLTVTTDHSDGIPVDNETITFSPAESATFLGGDIDSFRKWVNDNIVYPEEAKINQIAGKVFVQFCISRKGELVDLKIVRSVDQLIDEETLRVLKLSPKWNPAKQGGTPVKQLFTIPVSFILR